MYIKKKGASNGEYCFSVRQRSHVLLFDAIKIIFNTRRGVENDGKYMNLVMSSKKDLQTVVDLFSHSHLHPLIGLKNRQYQQ